MSPITHSPAVSPLARATRARAVARVLLACVRGEAWRAGTPDRERACRLLRALATPAVLAGVPGAVHFHGVAGYAHRVLAGLPGLDPESASTLERLRAGGLHGHLRTVSDLPLLEAALGGAGVPWLVVKGPVLAGLHGAPDLRAYSDLDLLVPAGGFGDALEALERAGARVLARNWWHRLDVLAGEVPLVLPSGTAVDLHWHLLNEREWRRSFALPTAPLFGRARPVEVLGRTVRTLDETDTLLHLALHTAMSGGNRLVWLKDVEQILRVEAPPPAEVLGRAGEAGLALVLATTLDRVAATLGTPVPAALGSGLDVSRPWRRLAAVARRLPPPERARPGGSVDRLVSRATRTGFVSSARELASRATRWGLHTRAEAPTEHIAPADRQGDDARGRQAFLAAIGRAAAG